MIQCFNANSRLQIASANTMTVGNAGFADSCTPSANPARRFEISRRSSANRQKSHGFRKCPGRFALKNFSMLFRNAGCCKLNSRFYDCEEVFHTECYTPGVGPCRYRQSHGHHYLVTGRHTRLKHWHAECHPLHSG